MLHPGDSVHNLPILHLIYVTLISPRGDQNYCHLQFTEEETEAQGTEPIQSQLHRTVSSGAGIQIQGVSVKTLTIKLGWDCSTGLVTDPDSVYSSVK